MATGEAEGYPSAGAAADAGPRAARRGGVGRRGRSAAALAVALAVLPGVAAGAPSPRSVAPAAAAAGSAAAVPAAAADDCDPRISLNPDGPIEGPDVEEIVQRGTLVAGVDQNSYLFGYRQASDGQLVGFDIDIVKAIAEELLGDEDAVEYRTVSTARRFEALRNNEVDLMVRTVTSTCEREEIEGVDFSTPYFTSGQQLLVPKGSGFTSIADLAGRPVCTAEGSTGEAELADPAHRVEVVTTGEQLDCLVRLQRGLVDATLSDSALQAGQAAQDPQMEAVGPLLTEELYGVVVDRDDQALLRVVNGVLERWFASDSTEPGESWRASYDFWLAEHMGPAEPPPAPLWHD
ncbi:glutamate ABC transporter substrate-binding protein [Allostreptomyces psammosilenae]|uniref:Polar amino acid transport system substrate-binding protein n=1 Tax=Allostreptomyces psammosilenae TaxID=1892865 RepID=A0A853A4H2_9ACTN|nr:glutamate ABC transporter substrate-binding protein [Allostreptomyces psammosilenae]NYI08370.1 polar amino acid transport system substrate-binding protein [Allostreptomyces psammosilenae]